MAPEQWLGAAMGPACDIWAFGIVLHELLAGRRPFSGTGDKRPLHLRILEGLVRIQEGEAHAVG